MTTPDINKEMDPKENEWSELKSCLQTLFRIIHKFELDYEFQRIQNNPIFLYGPTKSGKTTALKTIDDYFSEEKRIKVIRLDAGDMAAELVKSIRDSANTKGFYDKLHAYDAILVDNIWVLLDKPRMTEEIFLLFGTLVDKGKLLIIACDIAPSTLSLKTKEATRLYERSITIEMKPILKIPGNSASSLTEYRGAPIR